MKIDIRTQGFELMDGLQAHTDRRIRFALDWARHDVQTIKLNFSDINGPRGGDDKRCQLRIPMPGIRDVIIEETAADLYLAVDRAIDRAARTLERRLSRKREFGPTLSLAAYE